MQFREGDLLFLTDGNRAPMGVTVLEVERLLIPGKGQHGTPEWLVTTLCGSQAYQFHCYAQCVDGKGWWAGFLSYNKQSLPYQPLEMQLRVDDTYDGDLGIELVSDSEEASV